ncbi:MAG: family 20 glycosylhydrolase [Nocardioides sp.]
MSLRRRTVLASLGAAGVLGAAPSWAGAHQPATIPGLRQWTPRRGDFLLARGCAVVIDRRDAERLLDDATLLAAGLAALSGSRVPVRVGDALRAGEVGLRLRARDPVLGSEGYRLGIGDRVMIAANQAAGAYYGGRTLLQLAAQGRRVSGGAGRDWPRYPERGLMVDIGRKHLPAPWLEARIHEMGWLKLNYLHLHFTEDLGWRIESEQRPRVHSDDHLTKAQVRRLVALAARHHITVVPEIDMPGHFAAGLRNYPELQLTDPLGQRNPGKLDYTLPGARRFARDLVREYLPLFPGRYWHLGGDEFLTLPEYLRYPQLTAYGQARHGRGATFHDGTIHFLNEMAALVKRHGRTPRAWADGIFGGAVARLDRDVVAEWWTDVNPLGDQTAQRSPQQVIDAGHPIMNCSFYPTYLAYRDPPFPAHPELASFYETWRPHRFRGPAYLDGDVALPYTQISSRSPANLGSKLHLWNDVPYLATAAEEAAAIAPRLRIMAEQTWSPPRTARTYATFSRRIAAVGDPPR